MIKRAIPALFILLIGLFIGGLIAAAVGAWSQERADQPPGPGTGRVTGRVIAAAGGRPIADAIVELHGWPNEPPVLRTATDKTGRFQFEKLPAGRYGLVASKRGLFLETRYGQRDPESAGESVSMTEGQHVDVEIRMPRAGVIAGRVLDERGDPLVYAGISVLKETPAGVERVVMGFSNSTTDDRGEYRIFGLPPGTYVLYALARQEGSQERRYAPTYYPGVLDPSLAKRLTVAHEDRSDRRADCLGQHSGNRARPGRPADRERVRGTALGVAPRDRRGRRARIDSGRPFCDPRCRRRSIHPTRTPYTATGFTADITNVSRSVSCCTRHRR
jgi:hypothetical protein